MALHGIDISNWQGGTDIRSYFGTYDFFIMKATEGTGFVDSYCDGWVQACIEDGQLWGFYHFAGNGDAVAEADYFYRKTSNYFGHGIPVLDWEGNQDVAWVNRFVERIHELTGIWPWIYANPWRFNQGGVNENCGRWVAAYQANVPSVDLPICAWQYTSTPIDQNYFYGDADAWNAYVTGGTGQGGEDMTEDQAQKLDFIYNEVSRTDDYSGRGTYANLYARMCWSGADLKNIIAKCDELAEKVELMEKMVDKLYCKLTGDCE